MENIVSTVGPQLYGQGRDWRVLHETPPCFALVLWIHSIKSVKKKLWQDQELSQPGKCLFNKHGVLSLHS